MDFKEDGDAHGNAILAGNDALTFYDLALLYFYSVIFRNCTYHYVPHINVTDVPSCTEEVL